jgi:hypothetical protein
LPARAPRRWCRLRRATCRRSRAADEESSRTQPIPIKPPPIARVSRQYVAIVAAGSSALDDPAASGSEALVVFAVP